MASHASVNDVYRYNPPQGGFVHTSEMWLAFDACKMSAITLGFELYIRVFIYKYMNVCILELLQKSV